MKTLKYQKDIDTLTAHPETILIVWGDPNRFGGSGGNLFRCVEPVDVDTPAGCLTQIRAMPFLVAKTFGDVEDAALTAAIRGDDRIPPKPEDIKVEDLPIFAEWQEFIDDYFAGTKTIEQCPKP